MTSLRGPGERNFNAVSHKQTRAQIQSVPVSFGLWDTALKFLSPGRRNDVTDHLASVESDGYERTWDRGCELACFFRRSNFVANLNNY